MYANRCEQRIAQCNWFSSLDLKSAFHQVSILPGEGLFTAFEANGQLYHFKRIPFGLKNAVPCFQCVVNEVISKYNCKGTYAYLDDITVCGRTREEHDQNLKCFLNAAKKSNITLRKEVYVRHQFYQVVGLPHCERRVGS